MVVGGCEWVRVVIKSSCDGWLRELREVAELLRVLVMNNGESAGPLLLYIRREAFIVTNIPEVT